MFGSLLKFEQNLSNPTKKTNISICFRIFFLKLIITFNGPALAFDFSKRTKVFYLFIVFPIGFLLFSLIERKFRFKQEF